MRRAFIFVLTACLLLCTACADKNVSLAGTGETTLGVNADGTIEEVTVEAFEADYYSETELAAYIQAVIDTFNEANPQPVPETTKEGQTPQDPPDAITVLDVTSNGKTASMDLLYQTVDLYNAFNECDLQAMPIDEAVQSGAFSDVNELMTASGKGAESMDEIILRTDLYVVVTQQQHRIVTSGKLVYYSENVEGIDDHTAVTAADAPSILLFKIK